jgi:hypothetical protein
MWLFLAEVTGLVVGKSPRRSTRKVASAQGPQVRRRAGRHARAFACTGQQGSDVNLGQGIFPELDCTISVARRLEKITEIPFSEGSGPRFLDHLG